jgi:hypothetical protein
LESSSKKWLRWAPRSPQDTNAQIIWSEKPLLSRTFSFAIANQKLGHPGPDCNLVSELSPAVLKQIERQRPLPCVVHSCPENGGFLVAQRGTSCEPGDRCCFSLWL